MIEVKHLTKIYGQHHAVDDISFKVQNGEILGFLGPNGAGKSTTMNIITGYLSSTSGQVLVDGHDVLEEPLVAKREIGYLPELPPLYIDMTVEEYLKFVAELKKTDSEVRQQKIDTVMEIVKVADHRNRLIKNLSKGYRQRVGLAQALIGEPSTIIMDEPTVGLDPNQIIEMLATIRELGKDHTIIFSSHILSEVQAIATRMIIINKGKIIAQGTPDTLQRDLTGGQEMELRLAGNEVKAMRALRAIPGVANVIALEPKEDNTCEIRVTSKDEADIRREIFRACADNQLPILLMENVGLTLEQIFHKLTVDSKER